MSAVYRLQNCRCAGLKYLLRGQVPKRKSKIPAFFVTSDNGAFEVFTNRQDVAESEGENQIAIKVTLRKKRRYRARYAGDNILQAQATANYLNGKGKRYEQQTTNNQRVCAGELG